MDERARSEEHTRSFYSAFIGRGDLAFDIGSNHGDRVGTFLSVSSDTGRTS